MEPNKVPDSQPQIKKTSRKYDGAVRADRDRGEGETDGGDDRETEREKQGMTDGQIQK